MKNRNPIRLAGIAFIMSSITFMNFTNSKGADQIRNVQILQLITCGMFLGIAIITIIYFLRNREK